MVFVLILGQVFELFGLEAKPRGVRGTPPPTPKPRERNDDNLILEIAILITLIFLLAVLIYVQKCFERLLKKLSEEAQERQDAPEVAIA